MRNILFVQFADSMYKRHNACDTYIETFYRKYRHLGYYRGKYNFEIPKWIAEISYFLSDDNKEVFYCRHDVQEVVGKIVRGNYHYVLLSLMNANQEFIYDLVKRCPRQKFLIGGYNDSFMKKIQSELPNAKICNSTMDVANILGVKYQFGTDYSLFKGEHTIPRLTMSYGCLNNCKFCIVPHGKIINVEEKYINQQVESFKELDYRLIYIDDKTFGQAENYTYLKNISDLTNKKGFNGFIVQTTAPMLVTKAEKFREIGVSVAEIGLETYNDEILKAYNKPCSELSIRKAVEAANNNGIKLIVNLIIGLPEETEETYQKTFDYVIPLLENGNVMGINPAIYTDYSNENNLGEIDFLEDEKAELHRKWWNKFNSTVTGILRV